MPPEGKRSTAEQIELVRRWIEAARRIRGTKSFPKRRRSIGHFSPCAGPRCRSTEDPAWVRNPIDAFVLAARENGRACRAARRQPGALLRRVYLDLTGLPPTPAEQERFAREPALAAVIDDLLDAPDYGERWARHWLDVVRYADSNGYERDAEKPFVWRYRDYVIEALNRDKPFDRFVLEQLAGDELPDALGRDHDRHRLPPARALGRRAGRSRDGSLRSARRHRQHHRPGLPRPHDRLRPLPRSQVRAAQHARLLQPGRRLQPARAPAQRPHRADRRRRRARAIYVWREPSAKAPETHVLTRGSPARPGDLVEPAVPAILVPSQPPFPPPGERPRSAGWASRSGSRARTTR